MRLTRTQVSKLCIELKEAYEKSSGEQLKVNSNADSYLGLVDEIDERGEVVRSEWLRNLFYYYWQKGDPTPNLRDIILDYCCLYVSDKKAAQYFLPSGHSTVIPFLGEFDVYWKGTTAIDFSNNYYKELELSLSEEYCLLTEGTFTYRGAGPIKLKDSVYVELSNESSSEKVYFILHVGEVGRNELNYIPGIFAAGDSSNIHPCSGPVILVRKSLSEVDHNFLQAFFESYRGRNLIRSWNIAMVLEELGKTEELNKSGPGPVKKGLSPEDQSKKLAIYLNQNFSFYYLSFDEAQSPAAYLKLGRGILSFGSSPKKVTIKIDPERYSTDYTGSASLVASDFLYFEFLTEETGEKHLTIKFKIGPGRIHPYAIGIYSNITSRSAITAGTIVLQHIPEKTAVLPQPKVFDPEDPELAEIPSYIKEFLKSREYNYIKTPTKGIFNDEDFRGFFYNQEVKKKSHKREKRKNVIFVASPLSFSGTDTWEELLSIGKEVRAQLESLFKAEVHFVGDYYDIDLGYIYNLQAPKIFRQLDSTNKLLLIMPERLASSALIIAGWALSQKISCAFFYNKSDRSDFPLLIRSLDQNIRYYRFEELSHIPKIIERIGTDLFPY